ncbi:MAG TPA: PKD domain-containing protein [Flavobacteriales bacterium]|nr:PKD domain-containing protein [Flavobacteriales bacterium]HNI04401.1 PKD domain-containing protein [Flavobacteriales bacterium]
MFHRLTPFVALCAIPLLASAQNGLRPHGRNAADLPDWAVLMYGADPDVRAVEDAYTDWFRTHPFEKTVHTQHYKFWLNQVRGEVDMHGHVRPMGAQERHAREQQLREARGGGPGWTWAGPDIHYAEDGAGIDVAKHCNVYTIDRSLTDPNTLYCGTESGGVYKSTDQAANWTFVTKDHIINAVSALRIHPTDPNTVLVSSENEFWRTTDGGTTWAVIGDAAFQALNISAWEFAFDPGDPNTILAPSNLGMYRSSDGGDTWTEVLNEECMTVAHKPDDPAIWYTIQFEPALGYSRFYKSVDHGLTWSLRDNGWYAPPPGEEGDYDIEGGRLAVTAADNGRIYAVLVGYQQAGASITTNGWVGTWMSTDAGETWTFPHGQIGTPYTEAHPNLMNFTGDDGDYTQIHYNTCIIASQIDADRILIGGLNLWRSNDASATYEPVGGYIGPVERTHPDMQELRVFADGQGGEEVWIGCDGGVYRSTDLVATHDACCRGLEAINLWGYDQGWNDDIRVGGRYHNGNMGYHEDYEEGEYFSLGGGEAPTGYVNYSDQRKTYFSDIDGKIMPASVDEDPPSFPMSFDPNESYYNCSSSRIAFDHRYFNVAWTGKDHKLYRSTNGGSSFNEFHAFGSSAGNQVLWIEQSYADPRVFVVQQEMGGSGRLWRSADDGVTWAQITLPSTSRDMYFTLGSQNAGDIWITYTDRPNGQKVYHSSDGGASWTNITTTMLDGEKPWAIAHQYGTDGGVYLGLLNGRVLYRNNSMADWAEFSDGLPAGTQPLRLVPFYKTGKIRLACWNLGVWEHDLYEPSILQAGFAAELGTFFCPGDSIHFVDHSVCSAGATYAWSFPGGTPSTSTEKYPTVVYSAPGSYDVTLIVTDNGISDTATSTAFISQALPVDALDYTEDFESGGFRPGWTFHGPNGTGGNWAVRDDAGGFGSSTHAMAYDNFYTDLGGARDAVWTEKLGPVDAQNLTLSFDVSYAQYGGQYSDTLAVRVSIDCGATWTEVYVKGGDELATAPDTQDAFVPTADQWRYEEVPLQQFLGQPEWIIAFENRGHYGNVIRVDNINLAPLWFGVEDVGSSSGLNVYPNPAQDRLEVRAYGLNGATTLRVLDAAGREVLRSAISTIGDRWSGRVNVDGLSNGVYILMVGGVTTRFAVQR